MCIFSRKKNNTAKERPVGAGFFFVKKKDGILRPCADYRQMRFWPGIRIPCFFLTPHSHSFTKPASWWTWTSAAQTTSPVSARATNVRRHSRLPPWSQPHPPSPPGWLFVVDHSPTRAVLHRQLFRVCMGMTAFWIPCLSHKALISRDRALQFSSQQCGSWSDGEHLIWVPSPF